jgi:hypothetical protein
MPLQQPSQAKRALSCVTHRHNACLLYQSTGERLLYAQRYSMLHASALFHGFAHTSSYLLWSEVFSNPQPVTGVRELTLPAMHRRHVELLPLGLTVSHFGADAAFVRAFWWECIRSFILIPIQMHVGSKHQRILTTLLRKICLVDGQRTLRSSSR